MEKALAYMKSVLHKQRINVSVIDKDAMPGEDIDYGLRRLSGRDGFDTEGFVRSFGLPENRIVYKLQDYFYCRYVMMRLPEDRLLVIGPYTEAVMGDRFMMELAAELSLAPKLFSSLSDCYMNIPYLPDDSFFFSLVFAFAELMWGGSGGYEVLDLNEELEAQMRPVETQQLLPEAEELLVSMQLMERRYAWENELMLMVSRGQTNRAEKLLPELSGLAFKQRLSDTVRNMKNYCIICNTLMRKAAQQGGVHPIYLDRVSTEYALKIEAQTDANSVGALVGEMVRDYGRLVKKHAMKSYSPSVRQAVLLIDSQLSAELSLRHIAAVLKLNPSYLSNLFRKETGRTITEFISRRRVEQACNLLRSTSMQIQDLAIYCGIPDANYFSKVFKKYTGMSPLEYRSLPPAKL